MLARHRANPFCAACHQRFDSFGLAYEGYGPIGDVRTKDLAGRPVDTAVTYPGGINGVALKACATSSAIIASTNSSTTFAASCLVTA